MSSGKDLEFPVVTQPSVTLVPVPEGRTGWGADVLCCRDAVYAGVGKRGGCGSEIREANSCQSFLKFITRSFKCQ